MSSLRSPPPALWLIGFLLWPALVPLLLIMGDRAAAHSPAQPNMYWQNGMYALAAFSGMTYHFKLMGLLWSPTGYALMQHEVKDNGACAFLVVDMLGLAIG